MQVDILIGIAGAKAAKGTAVVIDVFRASNTIIQILESGAKGIVPVGDLSYAYEQKKNYADYLLFGERGGLPPEGFDYGNSPDEASRMHLKGKYAILTTSAGSQGIVNAKETDEIIIASFANIDAVHGYLLKKNPVRVSLLAMGVTGSLEAKEDTLCAEALKLLLEGKRPDYDQMFEIIRKCSGADRLRDLSQYADLLLCMKVGISEIVPRYDPVKDMIGKY